MLFDGVAQSSEPKAAYVPASQAAHEPGADELWPVSLGVTPSTWFPQSVCAAQLMSFKAAYVPASHVAHEPGDVALSPVNIRTVPTV